MVIGLVPPEAVDAHLSAVNCKSSAQLNPHQRTCVEKDRGWEWSATRDPQGRSGIGRGDVSRPAVVAGVL